MIAIIIIIEFIKSTLDAIELVFTSWPSSFCDHPLLSAMNHISFNPFYFSEAYFRYTVEINYFSSLQIRSTTILFYSNFS